jgi:hypothetical protein
LLPDFLEQVACGDLGGHHLRVGAIPGPILELDGGEEVLAGVLDDDCPLAARKRGLLHDLVLDRLLVECFLNGPAGMGDLEPDVLAAVELDGRMNLLG